MTRDELCSLVFAAEHAAGYWEITLKVHPHNKTAEAVERLNRLLPRMRAALETWDDY